MTVCGYNVIAIETAKINRTQTYKGAKCLFLFTKIAVYRVTKPPKQEVESNKRLNEQSDKRNMERETKEERVKRRR